nr:MAG TPA: hypothetical protein [Caudoviricetes sp.]
MQKLEKTIKIITISVTFASTWLITAFALNIIFVDIVAKILSILSGMGLVYILRDIIKRIQESENEENKE